MLTEKDTPVKTGAPATSIPFRDKRRAKPSLHKKKHTPAIDAAEKNKHNYLYSKLDGPHNVGRPPKEDKAEVEYAPAPIRKSKPDHRDPSLGDVTKEDYEIKNWLKLSLDERPDGLGIIVKNKNIKMYYESPNTSKKYMMFALDFTNTKQDYKVTLPIFVDYIIDNLRGLGLFSTKSRKREASIVGRSQEIAANIWDNLSITADR